MYRQPEGDESFVLEGPAVKCFLDITERLLEAVFLFIVDVLQSRVLDREQLESR